MMSILLNFARHVTRLWLEAEYGPRCTEFAPGCECCVRWRRYDALFVTDVPRPGVPEPAEVTAAAERLVIDLYRATAVGPDAGLAAKDRYMVAAAYLEMQEASDEDRG